MLNNLIQTWSSTHFATDELTAYAQNLMIDETRKGVMTMALMALLLYLLAAIISATLRFGGYYEYTYYLLALLSIHVFLSARVSSEIPVLHLLGMTLQIVSGTALLLLAHKTQAFSGNLLANVVLLFMFVPLIPWGLREATLLISLVYLVFMLSMLSVTGRFDEETFWSVHFLMLGASVIALAVIIRNVQVRRHDIEMRFDLENAHREMRQLSYQDALTGAWNRRFLEESFPSVVAKFADAGRPTHFAILDLDNFKQLNDTCGHAFGDRVLQRFGAIFTKHLGQDGCLIRTGGDEFVLLFSSDVPEALIQCSAEALRMDPKLSMQSGYPEVYLSAGYVTHFKEDGKVSLGGLFKEADRALYVAKQTHGNQVVKGAVHGAKDPP